MVDIRSSPSGKLIPIDLGFDTTATGRRNDNAATTATLAAGSTLVLRIDQSCTGELMLEIVNT